MKQVWLYFIDDYCVELAYKDDSSWDDCIYITPEKAFQIASKLFKQGFTQSIFETMGGYIAITLYNR